MSDELRRQDGPAEPDRGSAPVAGSYLARSDPTGERTHLQMPYADATLSRFQTQQIHRARGRVRSYPAVFPFRSPSRFPLLKGCRRRDLNPHAP